MANFCIIAGKKAAILKNSYCHNSEPDKVGIHRDKGFSNSLKNKTKVYYIVIHFYYKKSNDSKEKLQKQSL